MTAPIEGNGAAVLASLTRVSKTFGATAVLDHVDLTVHAGEIVTLVGPNGSGKTTLVRILLGLMAPSAGEVFRRDGVRIGYVPQHLKVDDTLPISVARFLTLTPARNADLDRAVAEAGIGHILHHPLSSLSGGEGRRVLLARALLRNPDLLVLDEPAAGVDVTGQAALYTLISTLRRQRGLGILVVSHDLHLVMAQTDRVVCLNHHVCCTGHPETVSRHPEYIALFGREVSRNLAVYTHHHDHEHDLGGEPVGDEHGPGHGHGHGHHHHDHDHGHDHHG